MVLSSKFNLSPTKKPTLRNPIVSRRQSLISNIDKQLLSLDTSSINDGISKWYWVDEDGSYFLSIKYGKHPIELSKGKFSIICNNIDEVKSLLSMGIVLIFTFFSFASRIQG